MTFSTAYVQTAQDKKAFGMVYNKGLADERLVKAHLTRSGKEVIPSTKEEDMFFDVDCYVNGVPTSIKSTHSAAKYGTIGLELISQLTEKQGCATSKSILANKELTMNDVKRLTATGNWLESWWYNGKAEHYCFYIGEVLRTYRKVDIQEYINNHGYTRIRPLKAETAKSQGGKYRFCNAVSIYLPLAKVPYISKEMVETN